ASVLGRFGPEGLAAHRRARGEEEHPPELRVPPPDLELHHEFDPPLSRVEAETEHGERLARTWRLSAGAGGRAGPGGRGGRRAGDGGGEAGWGEAGWGGGVASSPGSAILAERVRGQLEAWVSGDAPGHGDAGRSADDDLVTSGLTLLRLVPEEVVVAGRSQLGLWGGDRAAAERAGRALVRLQSLLPPETVTTPVLRGGRTPDERIVWVPWGDDPPVLPEQSRPPAPPDRPDSRRIHVAQSDAEAQDSPGSAAPAAAAPFRRGRPAEGRTWDGVDAPPRPAELVDAGGRPVTVSGRGEASAEPARLASPALPGGGGPVEAWAGPWLHALRWWDPPARRRRALWQVVAGGVACLVSVEAGAAHLEAIYD